MARNRTTAAMLLVLTLAGTEGAAAQGQTDASRFTIERVSDGIMRLDRLTGAVTVCRETPTSYNCETLVEATDATSSDDAVERSDLVAQNERLRAANLELRQRLARIADLAAQDGLSGVVAPRGERAGEAAVASTSAEGAAARARREIDEAVEVTDYALRRFLELYRAFVAEETEGQQAGRGSSAPSADNGAGEDANGVTR